MDVTPVRSQGFSDSLGQMFPLWQSPLLDRLGLHCLDTAGVRLRMFPALPCEGELHDSPIGSIEWKLLTSSDTLTLSRDMPSQVPVA